MQTKRNNSDRKQIRFGSLLVDINKARKDEPLAAWVKRACKEKIERERNS